MSTVWTPAEQWQDAVDYAYSEQGKATPLLTAARLITAGNRLLAALEEAHVQPGYQRDSNGWLVPSGTKQRGRTSREHRG